MLEQRRSDCEFSGRRTYRIEAHCREYIPCGSLSVVLVTAVSVRSRSIELVHDLTDAGLCLPRLAAPVIKIDEVLDRLVSVRIVAHVHDLHLPDFVNRESIVAIIENRRNIEH